MTLISPPLPYDQRRTYYGSMEMIPFYLPTLPSLSLTSPPPLILALCILLVLHNHRHQVLLTNDIFITQFAGVTSILSHHHNPSYHSYTSRPPFQKEQTFSRKINIPNFIRPPLCLTILLE